MSGKITKPIPSWIMETQGKYDAMIRRVDRAMGDQGLDLKVTANQAILVMCLGNKAMSATDLIRHGYYVGTNPNYNLRALKFAGLLTADRDRRDGRYVVVKLTDEGLELCRKLREALEDKVTANMESE